MNRVKSKRGFTLVELIVTVAILGMVASMGVGIVANAIKNYSTASTTSQEQDTALKIEKFILNNARVDSSVMTLPSIQVPKSDITAQYVYFNDNRLITLSSVIEDLNQPPVVTQISYDGVESVTLQIRRQKPQKDSTLSKKCYMYLTYTIKMVNGYTLEGQAVMNNIDASSYTMTGASSDSYTDSNEVMEITNNSTDALVLVK